MMRNLFVGATGAAIACLAISLFAMPRPHNPETQPLWQLTFVVENEKYVLDHDLTLADCFAESNSHNVDTSCERQ